LEVPSDDQGCLQDIHWSMLAYGYFPTYLLGAAAAAQLAHYCAKDIPEMKDKIKKGEFLEIKAWLTNKVHQHGKRYPSLDAHFEAELGEPLNPSYYIDYLVKKYTELYQC
jgi:carboxypeptidase Taq